ncbi:Sialin [Armadillidium vulgare]|nr:Sialin [Armadillidium vulgare]
MSTTVDSGVVIANTIGFFSSGWMTYQFGWRSVFYFEGLLCFAVLPLWFIFVRNSPFDHPWLSNYEENILIENKIIKTKLGFYLENASYIIGITNFLSLVWTICCGRVSDLLINKKILSKTNTRKMFHMIGAGGEALLYMCVSLTGCRFEVVVVLWIMLYVLGTSTNASYRLNVIDIAPNFTGLGWNYVFYLTAAIEFLSCILYITLMTSKAQPWNFTEKELEKEQENGMKNKSEGKLIQ